MKSLKYIGFLLVIAVALLNSCNMDEHIKHVPTAATATSEEDVDVIAQGMYSRFNDPGMFKYQGHIMLTVAADDIFSRTTGEYASYSQRTLTSSNTSAMWNGLYATIANANNLIQVLDDLELSLDFEKRLYGEAYFIRAFSYYYLVRLYGGVPLRLTPTRSNSDFYLPRATIDEVYTQIFSDFKAASERLPLSSALNVNTELGRATKGAAQAILAQAYLTYANQLSLRISSDDRAYYEQAVVYADSVINSGEYILLPNYGDLFDINKETDAYREVIFGIRFQTDPTNRGQPAAGSEYALRFGSTNTYGVSAGGGNGNNTFLVQHWFSDYYRKGDYSNGLSTYTPNIDYRNEKAFVQRGVGAAGRGYAVYPNRPGTTVPFASNDATINAPLIAKYQDPTGKDNRNHGNDFFIIRMAEIYLIKAEALNELDGPTQDALDAFNEVRTRARTVDGVPNARAIPADLTLTTAVDKNTFRMKIFDDRGLELVAEGQRWFDLVRMRSPLNPGQTMYEYQFLHVLNNEAIYPRQTTSPAHSSAGGYAFMNAVYEPSLNVETPKFLLFPVPDSERLQNPNIGAQNPGW